MNEAKAWSSTPQPEGCIFPTQFYIDIEHNQFMIGSRFAPGIELFSYLLEKTETNFEYHQKELKIVALKLSKKLNDMIDWLKSIGIVHSDIKLENLSTLNKGMSVFLFDWGLVKILPHPDSDINNILPKYWPRNGTPGYVPPLSVQDINKYHDRFSVAALVAYMINGHTQIPLRTIVQFFEEEIFQ